MKSKNKNTTRRMETSVTSTSSTSTKVNTTIDTLKRFWKQNWHRIASAFAVLVVVCSIAFSCGVNAKALEIPPPYSDARYIDVRIRQIDFTETVEVNYELAPPYDYDPNVYYAYPFVNWYYYQEGIVLDSSGLYTFDDDTVQSSVAHFSYASVADDEIVESPTYTLFELNEFSALPSVIANGQSTDAFYPSDPYGYISFTNDAFCEAHITLVISRRESNGSLSNTEVYFTDTQYYLAGDGSLYDYLVRNINASNFVYYPDGVTTVYRPSQREFISSVRIMTSDSTFTEIGSPRPQYPTTYVTHYAYYNSARNLTTIMALLRGTDGSGEGGDYEAGYIDGRNSALTDNLGVADWLVDAGNSVMNFRLFSVDGVSVTIGGIFTVITGSLLLVFILKLFAGG